MSRRQGPVESRWSLRLPVVALALCVLTACQRDALSARPLGNDPAASETRLVIETAEGAIEIDLLESAAPETVRRLKRLVSSGEAWGGTGGFYDGLAFDFARPHIEIITSTREPAASFTFQAELDARSLGLDRQVVGDTAEAMSVVQRELLVAHREAKKGDAIPDALERMLAPWFESYTADYLIGVTRQSVNEALGYVYRSGLDSRPATRGSVMLEPVSPTLASARLSVLLADVPQRTGRWMVVGRVADGLEVAQAISIRPRFKDRTRQFRPVAPVVIESARLIEVACEGAAPKSE